MFCISNAENPKNIQWVFSIFSYCLTPRLLANPTSTNFLPLLGIYKKVRCYAQIQVENTRNMLIFLLFWAYTKKVRCYAQIQVENTRNMLSLRLFWAYTKKVRHYAPKNRKIWA